MKKPASLFRSASLIALVTMLSKLLGLVRDQMIAFAYGAALVSDAYLYAFQLPSFSLVLLGGLNGPFHTATVSVLSKMTDGSSPPTDEVKRVVSTFITITGLVFTGLSLLVYWLAPTLINLIAYHSTPDMKAMAVYQLQWMSPLVLMGCMVGILCGIANVYHRFFWASFAPSAINLTLIAWLLWIGPDKTGMALCVSTLLGGVLQVVMQLPDVFKLGFITWPSFNWRDPHLKTMAQLFLPHTVGTTIGQFNIYVAMFFVSKLAEGAWTAFVLGNRLIQLPIGVLTIALLVPLFPRLSRWVAEQDYDSLIKNLYQGVLSLWFVSFPIILIIFFVGQIGISVLFQRGAFDARDTLMVAQVLWVLSLSIIPYMLRDSITRVFYAFNDSKTPLIVGLVSIGVNAVFNALLVGPMGIAGIALSTVIVTIVNAALLCWLVHRHIADMQFHRLVAPTLQMLVATLGTGLITGTVWWWTHPWMMGHTGIVWRVVESLLWMGMIGVVYAGFAILLKIQVAQSVFARLPVLKHLR